RLLRQDPAVGGEQVGEEAGRARGLLRGSRAPAWRPRERAQVCRCPHPRPHRCHARGGAGRAAAVQSPGDRVRHLRHPRQGAGPRGDPARSASRWGRAGKRVGEVRPIAPPETGIDAPRLPAGIVLRTDPDTGVTMQEFPETRRALDAAMATGDLSQLLEAVAKQADGDKRLGADYAYFARKLAPMMRALGVKLVAPPADADYAGAYRIGSNDVWIRQALPEIIIHEALHAATSASLTSRSLRNASPVVRKAVAEFNDLLAAAQAHAAGLDMATLPPALRTILENPRGPLSNTKELLAYGMSSRTFQNWLDSIPAPADRKPKTAFE